MSLSNGKSAQIKKDRQIKLHRSFCVLVISKEDKKTGLLECSGMTWRLIFVHMLIKADLWGFSHLLEHDWLAVKLIAVLTEKMLSPPDGPWWPFDRYNFSLLLYFCKSGQQTLSGLATKVGFCLLWQAFSYRFGADRISSSCHGSADRWVVQWGSFTSWFSVFIHTSGWYHPWQPL